MLLQKPNNGTGLLIMGRLIPAITAKNFAQSILENNSLLALPVDIFSFAEQNDINIQAMPQELAINSIYGALLVKNDSITIYYSTVVNKLGFQNFTIAHELGHYFLEGHIEQVIGENGLHFSSSDFCSKDNYEFEADQFAAGLLMPEKLCRKLIGEFDDGLNGIIALAHDSMSSLTAAAIRYIDLTTATAAIVISSYGKYEYAVRTRDMAKLGSFPLRGARVPVDSLTAKVYCNGIVPGNDSDSQEMDSDLSFWLGGRKSIPCTEQVIKLGRTGKTLTVLTCSEIEEEDEDLDSDDDFERRWGLKFR
jgi:Zn-dependent peptidase ImmA (M78 family)